MQAYKHIHMHLKLWRESKERIKGSEVSRAAKRVTSVIIGSPLLLDSCCQSFRLVGSRAQPQGLSISPPPSPPSNSFFPLPRPHFLFSLTRPRPVFSSSDHRGANSVLRACIAPQVTLTFPWPGRLLVCVCHGPNTLQEDPEGQGQIERRRQ